MNTANRKRNVGSQPREREPVGLRIIGGRLRGRRLMYGGDNRVRPMKDRVRESVFNLIGPVTGLHVIDLFCGTGALAIEAISRGATSATLIDAHLPTLRNARDNIQSLELAKVCDAQRADAFFWSHDGWKCDTVPRDRAWIVFCSPPYELYVSHRDAMMAMLTRLATAAPVGSLFVIEADERFDFTTLPITVPEKKRRSYPPAEIGIFTTLGE